MKRTPMTTRLLGFGDRGFHHGRLHTRTSSAVRAAWHVRGRFDPWAFLCAAVFAVATGCASNSPDGSGDRPDAGGSKEQGGTPDGEGGTGIAGSAKGGGGSGSGAGGSSRGGAGGTAAPGAAGNSGHGSGIEDAAAADRGAGGGAGDETSDASVGSRCVLPANEFLTVSSYPSDTADLHSSNQVAIHIQLTDLVFKGLNLSDITFRYWFTVDGNARDTLYFDGQYCQNSNGYVDISKEVRGVYREAPPVNTTPKSDTYLEFSLTENAGSMSPNGGTAVFSAVIRGPGPNGYSDSFDSANDYSYSPKGPTLDGSNYSPTRTITAYYKGVLAAGCEPSAAGMPEEPDAGQPEDAERPSAEAGPTADAGQGD